MRKNKGRAQLAQVVISILRVVTDDLDSATNRCMLTDEYGNLTRSDWEVDDLVATTETAVNTLTSLIEQLEKEASNV